MLVERGDGGEDGRTEDEVLPTTISTHGRIMNSSITRYLARVRVSSMHRNDSEEERQKGDKELHDD